MEAQVLETFEEDIRRSFLIWHPLPKERKYEGQEVSKRKRLQSGRTCTILVHAVTQMDLPVKSDDLEKCDLQIGISGN